MSNQWDGGHIIAIQISINRTPNFPCNIWQIIASFSNLKSRLTIRQLSIEHRNEIFPVSKEYRDRTFVQKKFIHELAKSVVKIRGWGYTCASCGNDAFVPVKPYFDSGLCPSKNSIQCLRCCRDMFRAQKTLYLTHQRTCFNGCCKEDWVRPFNFNAYTASNIEWWKTQISPYLYGARQKFGNPRAIGALAHHTIYKNMDQACIGNTICDDCGKQCYTVINAAVHIRNCYRSDRPKRFDVKPNGEILCVYIKK